jgi:hypothetical protein
MRRIGAVGEPRAALGRAPRAHLLLAQIGRGLFGRITLPAALGVARVDAVLARLLHLLFVGEAAEHLAELLLGQIGDRLARVLLVLDLVEDGLPSLAVQRFHPRRIGHRVGGLEVVLLGEALDPVGLELNARVVVEILDISRRLAALGGLRRVLGAKALDVGGGDAADLGPQLVVGLTFHLHAEKAGVVAKDLVALSAILLALGLLRGCGFGGLFGSGCGAALAFDLRWWRHALGVEAWVDPDRLVEGAQIRPNRLAEVGDHRLGVVGEGTRPRLDVVAGKLDAGGHDLRVEPSRKLALQLVAERLARLLGRVLGEELVRLAVADGLIGRGLADRLERRDLDREAPRADIPAHAGDGAATALDRTDEVRTLALRSADP